MADNNGKDHPQTEIDHLGEGKKEAEKTYQASCHVGFYSVEGKGDGIVPIGGKDQQQADDGPVEMILG